MERPREISAFGAFALALTALLTLPVLSAYALDLVGLNFTLPVLGALLAAELVGIAVGLRYAGCRFVPKEGTRLGLGLVAGLVAALPLLLLLSPNFLPTSRSIDAVHHYLLVDYLYQNQHLIHGRDPALASRLAEMIAYPFAACLVVALLARTLAQPPVYLMAPTAALFLGVAAVFIYATASEFAGRRRGQVTAFFAVLLFAWPVAYTYGGFTRDFYLTQFLGVTCVLGLGYWLTRYVRSEDRLDLAPILALGATLVFTYPTLGPSFALAFVAAPLARRKRSSIRRGLTDCALVGLPLAILAAFYLHDRLDVGLGIIRYEGLTISPGLNTIPPGFLALTLVGLLVTTIVPSTRAATILAWATLLQTAAFYVAAASSHALATYAAEKMFYLLLPELAVVGGIGLVLGQRWIEESKGAKRGPRAHVSPPLILRSSVPLIGLALAGGIGYGVSQTWLGQYAVYDPRPRLDPPLNVAQVHAALWMKSNLPSEPVDFLIKDTMTAAWVRDGLLSGGYASAGARSGAALPSDQVCADLGTTGDEFVGEDLDRWTFVPTRTLFRQGQIGVLRRVSQSRVVNFDDPRLLTGSPRGNLVLSCAITPTGPTEPGKPVSLGVVFGVTGDLRQHYLLEARLMDRGGHEVSRASWSLTPLQRPVHLGDGDVAVVPLELPVPATTPSGAYRVELVVFDERWATIMISGNGSTRRSSIGFGPIVVATPNDLPPASIQPERAVGDHLGNALDLVGFDPPSLDRGSLTLDLYWRATQAIPRDDTFFVQLLDARGRVVAQTDHAAWNGGYPTSAWQPDTLVRDRNRLTLPANLPPGSYQLIVGAYPAQTLERLPVRDATGQLVGDHVSLLSLQIR